MKSMLYAESIPSRKTTMRRALAIAAALVLGAPATLAFAHDPGEYQGFFNHFYDHQEHQQFHQQFMTSTTRRVGRVLRILSNTETGTAPTEPRTGNSMRTIRPQGMTITVTAITDLAHT